MEKPSAVALFSGGKDSVYSLQESLLNYKIVAIIAIISELGDLQMTDAPEIENKLFIDLVKNLPFAYEEIIVINGENYLSEVVFGIEKIIKKYNTSLVITGDLGHPDGIDKVLSKKINASCISPANEFVKQFGHEAYLKELTNKNIVFILSGIRNNIINSSFIGRNFDTSIINALKKESVDITGEDGEFQTLVIDAPIMKRKLIIDSFLLETVSGRDKNNYKYTKMKRTKYRFIDK